MAKTLNNLPCSPILETKSHGSKINSLISSPEENWPSSWHTCRVMKTAIETLANVFMQCTIGTKRPYDGSCMATCTRTASLSRQQWKTQRKTLAYHSKLDPLLLIHGSIQASVCSILTPRLFFQLTITYTPWTLLKPTKLLNKTQIGRSSMTSDNSMICQT